MRRFLLIATVSVALFMALSCSGMSYQGGHFAWQVDDDNRDTAIVNIDYESLQIPSPRAPRPGDVEAGTGIVVDGFELLVLDDAGYPADSAVTPFDMTVDSANDKTVVKVTAENAEALTSALFCLKYDPETLSPVSFEDGGFLGGTGEAISLFVNREGEVHSGIARLRPDINGAISGSGTVAKFTFTSEPWREPAKNPYPSEGYDYNKVTDLTAVKTEAGITLSWTEKNVGDYDNSGEVGVPDITPIAQHYLHAKVGEDWPDTADALIDGDGSGDIGIADITPIANNYLNAITGYNAYRVVDTGGVPDFTGVSPLANPIYPSATSSCTRDDVLAGSDPPDVSLIYSFTDSTIEAGVHYGYVVRPVSVPTDNPSEGLDSNYCVPEFGAEFSLQTDKASYTVGEQIILMVYLTDPENCFSTNARFDYDPTLVSVSDTGIVASIDETHPNMFADSLFFGVIVDSETIAFNNTQKKGQDGLTSAGGVLAYVVFDTIAAGNASFFIHDPSDFVWLRSPVTDFTVNKLPHGVLNTSSNPLVVPIA